MNFYPRGRKRRPLIMLHEDDKRFFGIAGMQRQRQLAEEEWMQEPEEELSQEEKLEIEKIFE